MMLRAIRETLAYTVWADRAMLAALAQASPEDLHRDTGSSFPSLLDTMGHILGAERVWLSRFVGNPGYLPALSSYDSLEAIRAGFEEFWPELESYMASLDAAGLAFELTWTNTKGVTRTQPVYRLLLHFVNHSSYHRGQLVTMLRQLGYTPPGTDMVYHLADQHKT
jgi:uncharacterized damage-inducible protein DinB